MSKEEIILHTDPKDWKGMRKAGKLAAELLDYIANFVVVGVTTERLDYLCVAFIKDHNAIAAPLNYHGFPKSICTSVNHVICHGIPSPKILKNGDIVNIDVTVIVDGWYGDSSRMYYVGEPSIKDKRLCQITYDALMLGIEQVKPGNTIGDIGYAIQTYAEKYGYSIVREYCGHGLGKTFHADPNILHYGRKGQGMILKEGMFFTIEPMINAGKKESIVSKHDNWTVTTKDKSRSAQFEHSMGVTKDGVEIFTLSPKSWDFPPYK